MTRPLSTDPQKRASTQCWDALSKAIRLEAADDDGTCVCVTCGVTDNWKKMDAGHWISGRRESVLFEEDQIHCQCNKCNRYHYGNTAKERQIETAYNAYMHDRYGQNRCDELLKKNQKRKSYSLKELLEMLQGYKARIKSALK